MTKIIRPMSELGNAVRHARESLYVSQDTLAEMICTALAEECDATITGHTILNIEKGYTKHPHVTTLKKLAKVLTIVNQFIAE